jgi:hypothetical protein
MTPEHFHLLRKRFHEAQKNGLHKDRSSPVQSLASEIAGLLQDHQARLKTPKASPRTLETYSRILPQQISAALQQCVMVSKEKMASALDFDPGNSSYWSERHRDIVFGANYNAFATKFTGFSICHPVYDDTKMLKCVQHSLRSAMCSELPTATFLVLPNWEIKSINAYRVTGHWCEITQNTVPRLASSPRQNSHMQCQPCGRVYNVISPTTPGVWLSLLSGTKKQISV